MDCTRGEEGKGESRQPLVVRGPKLSLPLVQETREPQSPGEHGAQERLRTPAPCQRRLASDLGFAELHPPQPRCLGKERVSLRRCGAPRQLPGNPHLQPRTSSPAGPQRRRG